MSRQKITDTGNTGVRGWALVMGLVGALALLGATPGAAAAKAGGGGVPQDYKLMYEEYKAAGGLGFLHKTEELLRLAMFEQALMRYRFLKGQVAGQAEYRPLVRSIDQRLHLLQRQMHLTAADISPLPRRRVALPPKPEPKPPPALEKAKAAEPGATPPPAALAEPTGPEPQTPPVVESGAGAPAAVPGGPPSATPPATPPPASPSPATPGVTPAAPLTPGSAAHPAVPAVPAPTGGAPAPAPAASGEGAAAPAEAKPPAPVKKSFWQKVKGLVGR